MISSNQLNYNRNIVFVCGSNYSGKSLMGHMLAMEEGCLYNYSSISPKAFFKTDGELQEPKAETLKKLIKDVKTVCFYLNGGNHVHENERWLRKDLLYGYNYDNFQAIILKSLNININLVDFYILWDQSLQLSRKNGTKTDFSVFEVENIYEYKDTILSGLKNVKFIDILRNPFKQICSQKIDILMRGPKKNFSGALSSKNNIFFISLMEMIEQYTVSISSLNDKFNYYLNLDDLRNLSYKDTDKLSLFIFGEKKIEFTNNLMNASRIQHFKNEFINFQSSNRSYFQEDRQSHHNVKINRNDINKLMFFFEKEIYKYIDFYGDIKKKQSSLYKFIAVSRFMICFPIFLILSLIIGFKDLKRPFNLFKKLKLRINSFNIVWSIGLKVTVLILRK